MDNLGVFGKSLVIFLAVIIASSISGSIFGIVAGGTFSETMSNFGNSLTGVNRAVIKPFKEFLTYFGLSSSYGGEAYVYERLDDDIIYSDLVPDDAYYCSIVISYSSDNSNILNSFLYRPNFIVFFARDGSPLAGYIWVRNHIREPGYKFTGLYSFSSIDVDRCFYNSLAKYQYIDLDFVVSDSINLYTIRITNNSALIDYSYAGNFTDLNQWLN